MCETSEPGKNNLLSQTVRSSSPDNDDDDDDDDDSYNVDIRCVLGTENLGPMPSGYLQGSQVSWGSLLIVDLQLLLWFINNH